MDYSRAVNLWTQLLEAIAATAGGRKPAEYAHQAQGSSLAAS